MTFLRNPFTAMAKRIGALAGKPVIPAAMAELIASTLSLQEQAFEPMRVHGLDDLPADTPTRFELGLPLVQRGLFPIDEPGTAVLALQILALLQASKGDLSTAANELAVAISDERTALILCRAFLQGEDAVAQLNLPQTPKSPRLAHFVAASAVSPSVRKNAAQFIELQALPKHWDHGSCPVCGSLPLSAHLEGREGQRVLTCSLCATSYRVSRLCCPVCLERDAEKLPYLSAPELPGFRLDACETCNHYVKTTDFREMDRKSVPEIDDLESMALDALAGERGLRRASFSAWGF